MWGGGRKVCVGVCVCVCVCMCFFMYLFCYTIETNLRFFIIFQRLFLGTPTRSGIMLFVTLFNGFRPWTNVGKIFVLDVLGILEQPLYSFQKIFNFIYIYFSSFNFINYLCNIIFINVFCIFVFLLTRNKYIYKKIHWVLHLRSQ